VAQLRDETSRLRVAWDERRRDYDVASRDESRLEPVLPPRTPTKQREVPLPDEKINPHIPIGEPPGIH
jgi:hypothetical protein